MKTHLLKSLMAGALMIASLVGCGGGGSSSQEPQPAVNNTVIKGTASAGIIYPGTVSVYAVSAGGAKGALLGSAPTSIDGKYSVSLGAYSGAIQVEVNGTYTDEATGHTVTIAAAKPLHSMVDSVDNTTSNNRVVSVTPLTELAWRKASNNGTTSTTPAAMVTSNKLVDDLYKISDIVGTEPVRPDNASMANASQESQAYTLTLASISKMSSSSTGTTDIDKLDATLTGMKTEIENAETSGSMSSTSSSDFAAALGTVALSNDFPSAATQLSDMGKKSQLLTLTTSGTLPAGTKIYAIEGTIALPVNSVTNQLAVSLRAESNGRTLSDVIQLTGLAKGMGADPVANYLAQQQQVTFVILVNATGPGIGIGDFATLAYNAVSGTTVTAADFSVVSGSVSVKDSNGADISGVTVTLK
jgi:hypothetical protein